MSEPTTHVLKTWPQYFAAVMSGSKTFEVRKHDRDFKVGDALELREWDPQSEEYSGRLLTRRVTYLLTNRTYVKDGYCVMGLSRAPVEIGDELMQRLTNAQMLWDLNERRAALAAALNQDSSYRPLTPEVAAEMAEERAKLKSAMDIIAEGKP